MNSDAVTTISGSHCGVGCEGGSASAALPSMSGANDAHSPVSAIVN
jgi:hypothetical protein